MEEIDIKICLNKINKDWKNIKKLLQSKKINIKRSFIIFFVHGIKMGRNALIFDKQCINKNAFHRNKKPSSIDKLKIKKIVLSKIHMVKKGFI